VVVAIGYPEGGRQLCASLPFPVELLYLDPDRELYKVLELKDGLFSFFSPAAAQAWKDKDIEALRAVVQQYTMIKPPTIAATTQQGGLYVIDGDLVKYAWQDPGVGAHAPNKDVLAACCP